MAEYVKLRLAAAKLGVTMALLGLIGGIAEKARAATAQSPVASEAAGLPGGTLGTVVLKLDRTLSKLEQKISTAVLTTKKLDQTFLKIKSANTEFLKIKTANASFLKIDDANSEFLKIESANSTFLKIDDAANEFLKITDAAGEFLKLDGTAANSQKLGGMTASQFVQGQGGTEATSLTIPGTLATTTLLQSPDKMVTVSVAANADQVVVHVNNNTGALLPAVMMADGSVMPANGANTGDLQPGDNTFTVRGGTAPHQFQLQTFGDGSSQSAVTTTLSTEASPTTNGAIIVVCQMLIGLL